MATLDFYDDNAEEYAEKTFSADLSDIRKVFSSYLPANGRILDLGCGSGRDSAAFTEKGFDVVPVDGSVGMCMAAEERTGLKVRHLLFEDLDYMDEFDGVWACCSLLHVPSEKLPGVLALVRKALRPHGMFFICFKKGDFEGVRPEGRYYTDLTAARLGDILSDSGFEVIRLWEGSEWARDTVWSNALCCKTEVRP